jgi:4-amino-4-deoxy-L-arabinose transferase-like glycosyltransferase
VRLRDVPIPIAVILAVALLARVLTVAATGDYAPAFDAADYNRHALSITTGDGYPRSLFVAGETAFRPPAYPYLLAAVYEASGNSYTVARLAGALLGTLVVLFVYLLGRRLFGEMTGLVAAAVAAVFPSLVFWNAALLTEPLFLALELGAVLAALAARDRRSLAWAAGAGALAGTAALARSNGIVLVPILAVAVWTVRPRLTAPSLAAPAALLASAVLVLAPWTIRNAVELDSFVPVSTQAGFGLAGTYNEQAEEDSDNRGGWRAPLSVPQHADLLAPFAFSEPELERELRDRALDYAADHPGYALEAAGLNALRAFGLGPVPERVERSERHERGIGSAAADVVTVTTWLLLLLALVGAVLLVRRRPRPPVPRFVWAVPLLMLAVAVPLSGQLRHRAPAEPFLALLAGVALAAPLERRYGGAPWTPSRS